MSRLTIKNSDGSYSQPTHTTFENMFYKLADLEDVLEEFGIESAEELRNRITVNKEFVKQVHKEVMQEQIEEIVKTYYGDIIEENQQLKSQLSKAIVPKFETYQPLFYITQYYISTKGVPEYDIIKDKYYVAENENEIIMGWNYAQDFNQRKYFYVRKDWVFATQAEAQAKLDEIRRKGNV